MTKSDSRSLIIDAQLLQSYTFHRGMGKYSLALLNKLAENTTQYTHKVIVFNNISGYLKDEEIEYIKEHTPGFSFEYLDFKHIYDSSEYKQIKKHNRWVIDQYIQKMMPNESIDYLILSLFQETELSAFPTYAARKSIIVYDLIPLQFFSIYLQVPAVIENYLARFDTLMEADHFFPISRSVANDLALHVGIPDDRITPIYGAPAKRKHLAPEPIKDLVNKKIILLPSGDDVRKNNDNAAKAFHELNLKHKNQYTLVITSAFTDATRERIEAIDENVVFTGNVSERQLSWLYDESQLVFFPSESEGLGMPVLEAIEFDKKVVCSDIAVFKEISETDLFFCDPYDISNMAQAMDSALASGVPSKKVYEAILADYSWDQSAKHMKSVFDTEPVEVRLPKKRIAIFAPSPKGFSGIGKVVQEQHYTLNRYADVTYFLEDGISDRARSTEIRKNFLGYVADTQSPWSYTSQQSDIYDQTIYHIGNGEYHTATLIKALSFPDTVILHDTRIRGLFNVCRSQGLINQRRYEAEDVLQSKVNGDKGEFLVSLLNKQKDIIVHSEHAIDAVNQALVRSLPKVKKMNLAIPVPYFIPLKKDISGPLTIALAGVTTGAKGLGLLDDLIKNLDIKVKIFGFSMIDENVKKTLLEKKDVTIIESPSDTRYMHELDQSDIMLNFRNPYHGETSYSTLEGIRSGKIVIVNDMGWFSELPDEFARKVSSEEHIVKTIKDNTATTADVQIRAREFIKQNHGIDSYIKGMLRG